MASREFFARYVSKDMSEFGLFLIIVVVERFSAYIRCFLLLLKDVNQDNETEKVLLRENWNEMNKLVHDIKPDSSILPVVASIIQTLNSFVCSN